MTWPRACLAALLWTACARTPQPEARGRLVVALTIDWEGAALDPAGLAAIETVRAALGGVPITHFVCPAYLTKPQVDPAFVHALTTAVHPGDELAMHLHAWRSLAVAAGIAPKLSPSFLTGTEKLLEVADDDAGFDIDLDAYDVTELRALLRTSRRLLEQAKLTVSHAFRAGGYLGTPKVLEAALDEGYVVDSSALDYRQLDELHTDYLTQRLQQLWGPSADLQPTMRAGVLEMPIAAVADYTTTNEIVAAIDAAYRRLQSSPDKDQFLVLAFHQETASEMAGRIRDAFTKARADLHIHDEMVFTTIEAAADLARMFNQPAG